MMLGTDALDHARSLFRQRRARDALFASDLFGEPAWDLLLTLYIARCENRRLSMKALSRGLRLSFPDALQWVRVLEASYLIQKIVPIEVTEASSVCISEAGSDTVTTMLLERPVRMSS